MKSIELLAPAQNKKSIKGVANLANAVYFGTDALNMRMNANNISIKDLPDVVEFCHSSNLKAYLTSNVIVYENELDYLENLMGQAKDAEIDAIIVHDFAAIETAKELGIPFHISTQTSISNSKAAKFYEKLGAERIILARECSLVQIKEIAQKLKHTEIETFIHGAQCTSVSGRCYFSAYAYNDPNCSANRGQCLQPCRHEWTLKHKNGTEFDYKNGFFLNSKDMNMIDHVPELIDAGIASFKIEGRMRDAHYIQTVVRCYREAIDSVQNNSYTAEKIDLWQKQLNSVYNRGYSTGFYFHRPYTADITVSQSGNLATHKKVQIGKVTNYFRNVKAAKIQLNEGKLRLGDEIIIEGAKMGTFLTQKLTSIQIKMKSVTETPIASPGHPILISIGVDEPIKKGDWVYRYIPKLG